MGTIILISHGDMANGVKSSLEMIIGKQKDVHVVSLKEGEDNILFEKALKEKMESIAKPVTIIADLLGGTPCNTAVKNYSGVVDVTILAGMSLPLAIECATNSGVSYKEMINTAQKGIIDVKEALKEAGDSTTTETIDLPTNYKEYKGKAKIVNARIDERLIHGQVAGIWTTSLDTQRIVVANDEAASDALQRSSLRLAAPSSMRLSVLSVEKAAENIESGKYGKQRIFLLFKNPTDALRYMKAGGSLTDLNVGNMSFKNGAREVTKNIQVMPDEETVFKEIASNGVKITAQLVPNDPVVDFIEKLSTN